MEKEAKNVTWQREGDMIQSCGSTNDRPVTLLSQEDSTVASATFRYPVAGAGRGILWEAGLKSE